MSNELWVICEEKENIITKAFYGLLTAAKRLASGKDIMVAAVVMSQLDGGEIQKLREFGAEKIYIYSEKEQGKGYSDDIKSHAIIHYAKQIRPEIILMSATLCGRNMAPQIAMGLETGLTADCIELDIDENGLLIQTRPAYGGNIIAEIICEKRRPQMATVRPGVFSSDRVGTNAAGSAEVVKWETLGYCDNKITVIGQTKEESESTPIESVEVIVAGGAGVGSKEGFAKLELLANLLGGTSAASRAAVNAGYAPYKKQVGQSGKTISPKLYIACGISGAVQHLAGMSSSDYIIGINSDPKAPIFNVCDYGIVGKVDEIVQYLIDYFSKESIKN